MSTSKRAELVAAAAFAALLAPTVALAGDAAAGKTTYSMFCASCHGPTGKGDGPVGAVLNPPPRDLSKGDFKFDTNGDGTPGTDEDLMNVIVNGAAKYGGDPQMAAWGGSLSEADRANVIAFIRTLVEK